MRSKLGCSLTLFLTALSCVTCASHESIPDFPLAGDHRSVVYDSIVFEIVPIAGYTPSKEGLAYLKDRLVANGICWRANIHFVIRPNVVMGPTFMWNGAALQRYEDSHRRLGDTDFRDKDLNVFVAYLGRGPFLDVQLRTLGGLQYGSSSIAVWRGNIGNIEGAVLLHEFGHMLRIAGRPRDSDHPAHCQNANCVMYWTVDNPKADFLDECQQELRELLRSKHR